MKITASTVQPGDIVRGVGMLVQEVDPLTDFTTRLYGTVSTRVANDPDTGERRYEVENAIIDVPNGHLLRVRPSDAHFRSIRIGMVNAAMLRLSEALDYDALVAELVAIARMPKGRWWITEQHVYIALGALRETVGDDKDIYEVDDISVLSALDEIDPPADDDEPDFAIVLTIPQQ